MLEFYVDSLITIHFFNYHGGVIISDLMINGQIRDKEVRLIANDGEQLGVMSAREAQKLADEAGLDLVKISPKAKPPVCKIIDYGKYKYEGKHALDQTTAESHRCERSPHVTKH